MSKHKDKHTIQPIWRKPRIYLRYMAVTITAVMVLVACKQEITIPEGAFDEHVLDISGTWKIVHVWQNGIEITDRMDFSLFELTLNMDGNGPTGYQLKGGEIPFVVRRGGTWTMDDVVYPTAMFFSTGGDPEIVEFAIPSISGNSTLTLSFSLGCGDNSYTYELRK